MRSNEEQDLARFRLADPQAESVNGVSQCGTEFCLFVSGEGGGERVVDLTQGLLEISSESKRAKNGVG